MVVDIRYHLASLVAVFFALGLGILVGMSISSGEQGSELREQWMAAVEKELEALRLERKEAASRLDAALGERDVYRDFAGDLVAAVIDGRLAGGRAVLLLFGEKPDALERIADVIERSGATVSRRLTIGPGDGVRLSGELLGPGDPPHVVAILAGPVQAHRGDFETLLHISKASGAGVTAVVDGQPAWRAVLDELDVGYITHADSPQGMLSLVLLIHAKETGRYGAEADLAIWPKHLLTFAPYGGEDR